LSCMQRRNFSVWEAIEEFNQKERNWRFQGGRVLGVTSLALEVGFSGLAQLKGRDLFWVVEEIDTIRRYRPMTTSFPLNNYVVVVAYTNIERGIKGMSIFIVGKGTPGFNCKRKISKMCSGLPLWEN